MEFPTIQEAEQAAQLAQTPYQQHGCQTRREYLEDLAIIHNTHLDNVLALASMLGPNEDFDGLPSALEEHTQAQRTFNTLMEG